MNKKGIEDVLLYLIISAVFILVMIGIILFMKAKGVEVLEILPF